MIKKKMIQYNEGEILLSLTLKHILKYSQDTLEFIANTGLYVLNFGSTLNHHFTLKSIFLPKIFNKYVPSPLYS